MKWQIKAAAQTAFAMLPWGEHLNHLAQRANGSFSPESARENFVWNRNRIRELPVQGSTVVEIGTGWDGAGIIAFALEGAARIHSYDVVPHLRFPLMQAVLRQAVDEDSAYRERAQPMLRATTLAGFLDAANTTYHAPGDASATGLPEASVDLVYSNSVLEHIDLETIEKITAESARILRGIASHHIGLHDHLCCDELSAVHFLGLSPFSWWLINNRISFHNRLRSKHYIELFERHGGTIIRKKTLIQQRDLDALKRMRLRVFPDMPAEELAIRALDVDVRFHG